MPSKKQVDEIVKLVTILNSPDLPESEKMQAQIRLQSIKDDVTASEYGVAKDRISDVQFLEREIVNPKRTVWQRAKAKATLEKIVKEDASVRSMRKSLVREMKAGRSENVRDIGEYVKKHSKYQ